MYQELLETALQKRSALAALCATGRIFDGAGDGIPELFIDRYKSVALAHLLPDSASEATLLSNQISKALLTLAPAFKGILGVESIYLRMHAHDPRENIGKSVSLVSGPAVEELEVEENGLRFIVKPTQSLHAGLYVDMRDVRKMLLETSAGKRVLNTFCFTGSLGIAAACGGAPEVCQVDSSPSVLEWAKKNWELNRPTPESPMRFICDDCSQFIEREGRRVERGGKATDLIIMDPPSFGRSRSRIFSFRKDIRGLVELSFSILTPTGTLILTSNSREVRPEQLQNMVTKAADAKGWKIASIKLLYPPQEDFTSVHQDSIAMRGIIVQGG